MEKIDRTQYRTFLRKDSDAEYSLLGQGVEAFSKAYNPQTSTKKFIHQKVATTTKDSVQPTGAVSQEMYSSDGCYELAWSLRNEIGSAVDIEILDVFMFDKQSEGVYGAEFSKGTLIVNEVMGEDAVINYDLNYNGDVVLGTVQFDEQGKPTFTEYGSV